MTNAPSPQYSSVTEIALRLLQASSCFRPGAACGSLPCACAQSLVDALSPTPQIAGGDWSWGVDYGKDLLVDLNQLAHASGTTALLRDCLQRAYKEITRLRKTAISSQAQAGESKKAIALLRWSTWYLTPAAQRDWEERVEKFLADPSQPVAVAQAVPQRDEMVARALARIAAANFSDPETDDLTVPLAIELAEVQARLSYMEGKYGAIDWNTAVSSTTCATPVMQAAENAAKVVEGWSDAKRAYADRVTSTPRATPDAFDRAQGVMDATMVSTSRMCPDCGRAIDGPTHAAYCVVTSTQEKSP